MKKLSKIMTAVAAFAVSAALCCGFAACGGDTTDPTNTDNPSTPSTDAAIEYQFTGTYDELISFGIGVFGILGNMYEDGTCTIYTVQVLDLAGLAVEVEIPESGSLYTNVTEAYGTWTCEEDRDGIVTLTFSTTANDDNPNAQNATYQVYQENDGTFIVDYEFYFERGNYARNIDLTGSDTITYATLDDWETAVVEFYNKAAGTDTDGGTDDEKETAYTFTADEVTLISGGTAITVMDVNVTAEVYLYADGTVKAVDGMLSSGYAFVTETGTWEESDGTITIKITDAEDNDEKTYTVTTDADGNLTFTWQMTHDEGESQAVLVCPAADTED